MIWSETMFCSVCYGAGACLGVCYGVCFGSVV